MTNGRRRAGVPRRTIDQERQKTEATNFLCRSCNRCWHVTLGWVHQVDRGTCPGCEWRFACASRWD
ncbi:MAG: hypothetical protein ACRD0O_21610 [Acidimicrobiia bacterium]